MQFLFAFSMESLNEAIPFFILGTSENTPFAIWLGLLAQLFLLETPKYTKYSGISKTRFEPKSLIQIIKKVFSKVPPPLKKPERKSPQTKRRKRK